MMVANNIRQALVDTSFLVTAFDDSRPNHKNAKKYYRYLLDNDIMVRLSTVVIAEYQQTQPIVDVINTGNFVVLPYNYDHAIETAEIAYNLGGGARRSECSSRAEYKDDHKLMAQAKKDGIEFIITEDAKTLAKYCRRLNKAGIFEPKIIIVADGFDTSHFNKGQKSLMHVDPDSKST